MAKTIQKQKKLKKKGQFNKKGQIFLPNIVSMFMVILLLAVGVITLLIAVETISSENVIPRTTVNVGDVIRNETVVLNATAQIPISLRNLTGCQFTTGWPVAYNESGSVGLINSANYTVSACSIVASGISSNTTNLSTINISGYYQYTRTSDAIIVASNVSYGAGQFFENAGSIFTILGVVIIIGAIVIILFAIGRYSNATSF